MRGWPSSASGFCGDRSSPRIASIDAGTICASIPPSSTIGERARGIRRRPPHSPPMLPALVGAFGILLQPFGTIEVTVPEPAAGATAAIEGAPADSAFAFAEQLVASGTASLAIIEYHRCLRETR